MRKISVCILFLLLFLFSAFTQSAYCLLLESDLEGSALSGLNDNTANAQDIKTLSIGGALTVKGWVDSNPTEIVDGISHYNDLDFFKFSIFSDSFFDVFFDIDFADVHGLDLDLAVFTGNGQLIAYNDDMWPDPDPGSDSGFDPFIGALSLGSGTYYAVVSSHFYEPGAYYDEDAVLLPLSPSGYSVSGVGEDYSSYDGFGLTYGQYQLQIRTTVEDQPIPEPASLFLLGSGLIGFAKMRKRFIK